MAFNKGISLGPRQEREDAGMHERVVNGPCSCHVKMNFIDNKLLHQEFTFNLFVRPM